VGVVDDLFHLQRFKQPAIWGVVEWSAIWGVVEWSMICFTAVETTFQAPLKSACQMSVVNDCFAALKQDDTFHSRHPLSFK